MANTQNCLFTDFETRSLQSISAGSFSYASHPSTEILLIGYCWEDEDYVCFEPSNQKELKKFFALVNRAEYFVAHNMLFEIPIVMYQGFRYDFPPMPMHMWRCTMQMAGRAGLPLALEYAAKALKLKDEKLEFGRLLIHRFCIPIKGTTEFNEMKDFPIDAKNFLHYCGVDTVVSREIWKNCRAWTPSEEKDILFDLQNNCRGVPIDIIACKTIYDQVNVELSKYAKRLSEITNGRITKVTQIQRIKAWVQNSVNEEITSCDASNIIDILAGIRGPVDDVSREILEMRQYGGKSSTTKYAKYLECSIGYYIYGMQISFGAHTGRAISKLLNLYNLPKPSVEYDTMESLVDQLISLSHPEYVKAASTAIRGMIRAPKGKMIAVSDYAAIEARIVFWLADCKFGLDKYHKEVDLYVDMATHIGPKADRWLGKQAILGCGYGLGAKGFVNSCARWGVEVEFSLAEDAVSSYRETYPEVVDMWANIESAALKACSTGKAQLCGRISFKTERTKSGVVNLLCKLPSGRCITYPDVKIGVVTTPWGAKKKAVTYKKVADRGYFRDSTYGGKLMENICQGIARDIMYYGAQIAASEEFDILFTVYDEVVALTKEPGDIEQFNEALCTKPDWAAGLPLKAEGKLMKRYEKL